MDSTEQRTLPPIPDDLKRELEAVYAELSRDVDALGVGCWIRGDCCDFDRMDHRLYASSLEVAYVLEKHPEPLEDRGSLCPFWREGKCTERERRPLGCRTHFCDRRHRVQLEAMHERMYARLRSAAARSAYEWRYDLFVDALRACKLGRGGVEAP